MKLRFTQDFYIPSMIIWCSIDDDIDIIVAYCFVRYFTSTHLCLCFTKQQYYDFIGTRSRQYQKNKLSALHKILNFYSDEIDFNNTDYLINCNNHTPIYVNLKNSLFNQFNYKLNDNEQITKERTFAKVTSYVFSIIYNDLMSKDIKETSLSFKKVLLFYAYYKLNIPKRKNGLDFNTSHPAVFYRKQKDMAKTLKMSESTVSNIIKYLCSKKIIGIDIVSNFSTEKGSWRKEITMIADRCINENEELDYKAEINELRRMKTKQHTKKKNAKIKTHKNSNIKNDDYLNDETQLNDIDWVELLKEEE